MMHFTCDICGKQLQTGEDRFVVKIEVFAACDPASLTEADLDEDHVEAVGEMLRDIEELDEVIDDSAGSQQLRYDLCPVCRKKYLQAPLAKEQAKQLNFSEN